MTLERDIIRKFKNENKKPKYQIGAEIKDPDGTKGIIKEIIQGVNGNFYYKVDLGSSWGLDMLREVDVRLMPSKNPKTESAKNNEADGNKYYVCRTPFRASFGGGWMWSVKPNQIFKVDANGKWWEYDRASDQFVKKRAYSGDNDQFDVRNFGRLYDQQRWMEQFKENCNIYNDRSIGKVLDKIRQENEFQGTKSEILNYLENQDDKTTFLIRKV